MQREVRESSSVRDIVSLLMLVVIGPIPVAQLPYVYQP